MTPGMYSAGRVLVLAIVAACSVAPAHASYLLVVDVDGLGGITAVDAHTGAYIEQFTNLFYRAIATEADGNILAGGNSVIRRYAPDGTVLGVFTNGLSYVLSLAAAPDGSFYDVNGAYPYQVEHRDGTTGALLNTIGSASTWVTSVSLAPNGNIAVNLQHSVNLYDSSGSLLHSFTLPTLAFDVYAASDGDLFAGGAGSIYGYDGALYRCAGCSSGSGAFTQFGSFSTTNGLNGITMGPDGQLLAASRFGENVLSFDSTTGAYNGVFSSNVGTGPWNLAIAGPSGTPEPASFTLVPLGLLTVAGVRRIRRKRPA